MDASVPNAWPRKACTAHNESSGLMHGTISTAERHEWLGVLVLAGTIEPAAAMHPIGKEEPSPVFVSQQLVIYLSKNKKAKDLPDERLEQLSTGDLLT